MSLSEHTHCRQDLKVRHSVREDSLQTTCRLVRFSWASKQCCPRQGPTMSHDPRCRNFLCHVAVRVQALHACSAAELSLAQEHDDDDVCVPGVLMWMILLTGCMGPAGAAPAYHGQRGHQGKHESAERPAAVPRSSR